MNISSIIIGLAVGMILAFVSLAIRRSKDKDKYCPTCGRMLLIHEKEKQDVNE